MTGSNLSARIDRIEGTLTDQTSAIARLEATQEVMKDTVVEIKDALGKINTNHNSSSVWQKSLFGVLLVQSLLHGTAPPDIVKDLLGMIKGH